MDLVAGDLGAVGSHEGHVRQLPGLLQALRTNPPPRSSQVMGHPESDPGDLSSNPRDLSYSAHESLRVQNRCQANSAHVGQARRDSGLGVQVKILAIF